jgi:uncharacterized iron-regulated protein
MESLRLMGKNYNLMNKMDISLRSLAVGCCLALAACQSAPTAKTAAGADNPPPYTLVQDAKTGASLTPEHLLNALSSAQTVIVGEEHTNAVHHEVERWLLENLQRKRPQGSVLMEMLTVDQQGSVNQVKQALRSGTTVSESRIQETLRWNGGWPWALYRGVTMTALQGDYPLLSANITRQRVKELYTHPVFPEGERSARPEVHKALSAIIYLMHDGQIDGEQVKAMMAIQQQRDRFMASQLMNAPRPALLIAGGYHATKDIGVPLHLADLGAERPVVLMLSTAGTTLTAAQADYIWFAPKAQDSAQ